MRYTITPNSATIGDRKYTSYDVRDNLFVYQRENGTEVHGRRVATFRREEDAIEYAAWKNRTNDLPQPGDAA